MFGDPLTITVDVAVGGLRTALMLHLAGAGPASSGILVELLARAPSLTDLPLTLGVWLLRRGQLARAVELLELAVAVDPGDPVALNMHAMAFLKAGQIDAALAAAERAVTGFPEFPEALHTRAMILQRMGQPERALADTERALAIRPDYADALNGRGAILAVLDRCEEALACFDRALSDNPDSAEACNNRGVLLELMGRWDESMADNDRALALNPNYPEAYANRGNLLRYLNRHAEAFVSFNRALALRPDAQTFVCDRGMTRMALGDLHGGWNDFEARAVRRNLSQPQWTGEQSLSGRGILLHHEQGIGDTLQFCRYVPMLAALGARVILQVPASLFRLLRTLPATVELAGPEDPVAGYEFHCPLPSLPRAFGTVLQTIPGDVPYLKPDPDLVVAWKRRLSNLPGFKVGLVWAGNPRPQASIEVKATDRRRSITLAHYAPLGSIEGLCPISLQKDAAARQTQTPPPGMTIQDFTDELEDFADTAALVEALDLVITVDTAVAHLAGALGKPVWILNRFDACWRWLLDRSDTPWYPTARLFRQTSPGDWHSVIVEVASALRERVA